MFQKGNQVRHKNNEIDKAYCIMSIIEIKNDNAVCGYLEYDHIDLGVWTYPLLDFKKEN